jgi:medium-chain acyl-[acyl-carrier-protein] hydrolase
VTNLWLPRFVPNPRARLRLFCFPNAGAGASFYRLWQNDLGPEIQVLPVQLPGREGRMGEPLVRRLDVLVDALLAGLRPVIDGPFALFGHSMGALVSFELTRALRRYSLPMPQALFLSGHRAVHIPLGRKPLHSLDEPSFRQALTKYNGTPQAVLDHPEMMELFGPILRADFELCETYQHEPEPPLPVPLFAFGGSEDPMVEAAYIHAWHEHTRGPFRAHLFPGDHFYLVSQRAPLLREISAELAPFFR